jgi:hypothetical protein
MEAAFISPNDDRNIGDDVSGYKFFPREKLLVGDEVWFMLKVCTV